MVVEEIWPNLGNSSPELDKFCPGVLRLWLVTYRSYLEKFILFFLNLISFIIIFGSSGSWLLHVNFSPVEVSRGYFLVAVRSCLGLFRCTSFSSCRTWAQYLWCRGLVTPRHAESYWTGDQTRVLCIGRQIFVHCTSREAQGSFVILSHAKPRMDLWEGLCSWPCSFRDLDLCLGTIDGGTGRGQARGNRTESLGALHYRAKNSGPALERWNSPGECEGLLLGK